MKREDKRNSSRPMDLVELIRNRGRYRPYPPLRNNQQTIEGNDISSTSSGSLSDTTPNNISSHGERNYPRTLNLVQLIRNGRNANRSHSSISSEGLSINIANRNTCNDLNGDDQQGFGSTYSNDKMQNSIAHNEVEGRSADAITKNSVLEKEFNLSGKTVHGTEDGARKSTSVQTDPTKMNKQTSTTDLKKNTDCAEPPNEVTTGSANTHSNIEQPPQLFSQNSVKFPDMHDNKKSSCENIAQLFEIALQQSIDENPNSFQVVHHLPCDTEDDADSVNLVQAERHSSDIAIEAAENPSEAQHEVSARTEVNQGANSNVRYIVSEQSIDGEAGGDGLHIHPFLEVDTVFEFETDSEGEEDVALGGENNVEIDVQYENEEDEDIEDDGANGGEQRIDIMAGGDGPHNDNVIEVDIPPNNAVDDEGGFAAGGNAHDDNGGAHEN